MRVVGSAVHYVQVRQEDALSPSACFGRYKPGSSPLPGFPSYLGRRARRQAKAFDGRPLPVRDQSAFWSRRRGCQISDREPECRPSPLGRSSGDAELFGEYRMLSSPFRLSIRNKCTYLFVINGRYNTVWRWAVTCASLLILLCGIFYRITFMLTLYYLPMSSDVFSGFLCKMVRHQLSRNSP